MTTPQMTKAQISTAYQDFRAIPLDNLLKPSPEAMQQLAKARKAELAGKDLNRVGVGLTLLVKLAHNTSEAEFGEALTTGQLPAMKLSAEEMELARGGVWVTVGLIACAVAGGIVGYFSRPS